MNRQTLTVGQPEAFVPDNRPNQETDIIVSANHLPAPSPGAVQIERGNSGLTIPVDLSRTTEDPSLGQEAFTNRGVVAKLAAAKNFLDFQEAFETTTGMPLALRAIKGGHPTLQGSLRASPFCRLMWQTPLGRSLGLQTQQLACDGAAEVPSTVQYSFGITETAVRVKLGEALIAYLQTGQVFLRPPTQKQTRCAIELIKQWDLDVSLDESLRIYRQTPVVRLMVYRAGLQLLKIFADQLGSAANQILLQPGTNEPPPITQARQFIADHYRENISLDAVAAQAGLGRYYFCKKFKLATGLHFSLYVARVRIEKAKNLLLNPNYRISEIAYEIGFTSLTHFNRVFKKFTGYSPTEYRQHLPVT